MIRIYLLLCLFIVSCSSDALPKDVFPPGKMESVLYDVIRADEWVDFSILRDSTYRNFGKRSALYDSIFHIHSITKENFRKSLEYYQNRPDLLKGILDSLHRKTDPSRIDSVKIKKVVIDSLPPKVNNQQ